MMIPNCWIVILSLVSTICENVIRASETRLTWFFLIVPVGFIYIDATCVCREWTIQTFISAREQLKNKRCKTTKTNDCFAITLRLRENEEKSVKQKLHACTKANGKEVELYNQISQLEGNLHILMASMLFDESTQILPKFCETTKQHSCISAEGNIVLERVAIAVLCVMCIHNTHTTQNNVPSVSRPVRSEIWLNLFYIPIISWHFFVVVARIQLILFRTHRIMRSGFYSFIDGQNLWKWESG